MKKLLCLTLIILAVTLTVSAQNVFDNEGLLTFDEVSSLDSLLVSAGYDAGCTVVVVTADDFDGKSAEAYADDFFDAGDFGDDGILFLVSLAKREWHISTAGESIYTYYDSRLIYFEDELISYLSDGDFYGAFVRFAELCREDYSYNDGYYSDYDDGYYSDYDDEYYTEDEGFTASRIVIPVIFGLIVGLITVSSMKSQLNSVKSKPDASDYVKSGSLNVSTSYEQFLFRNVTKTRRESSSSGGSSGRSGGSSVHRSSSGRSHGGRGGRF